jgi:UDP-N-acetylmuramoylalanine--D-glutamate ligase
VPFFHSDSASAPNLTQEVDCLHSLAKKSWSSALGVMGAGSGSLAGRWKRVPRSSLATAPRKPHCASPSVLCRDLEFALFLNPAVPKDLPFLRAARELGKPVTMEMTLFLEAIPTPAIGVTGTKGKTTTCFATHHLLSGSYPRAELVGNMGRSAVASLAKAGEIAVVELSSFQTEGLAEAQLAPTTFVVTNLLEDHLDRYPHPAAYHEAKARVLDYQREGDWAILSTRPDDRSVLERRVRGRIAYFQSEGQPLPQGAEGVGIAAGKLVARWQDSEAELIDIELLPKPGEHYASNTGAAACAALANGIHPEEIGERLRDLPLIEHRQELVGTVGGVAYINDTTATAPAAAAASVRAYADRDIVLIAGGSSKRLDPSPFSEPIAGSVRMVMLLEGTATGEIREALIAGGQEAIYGPFGTMEQAVSMARRVAEAGTVVLLAPGAASFGMFTDEFARGSAFRSAVVMLASACA